MLPRLSGLVFGSTESAVDLDEYEELPLDEGEIRPGDDSSCTGAFLRPRTLLTEFASKIKLYLKLRKVGKPDRQFFVSGYWRKGEHKTWVHFVTTDIQTLEKDEELTFSSVADVGWFPSEMRYLRFEVYKVKDAKYYDDFNKQKFIGCVTTSLIEVLLERAKRKQTGWKKMDLEHPTKKLGEQGIIAIFAEEDRFAKDVLSMELSANSVKSTDYFKARADPYLVVYRGGIKEKDQVKVEALMRTQVARKTGSPNFGRVQINLASLYGRSESSSHGVMVEMRDWFRVSRHNSIGEAWLSINDLRHCFLTSQPYDLQLYARPSRGTHVPCIDCKLKSAQRNKAEYSKVGVLRAQRVNFERQYTLFDHLRGGLELKLAVAIDFSRSCKMEPRKEMGGENPIVMAIRACGDIMNKFDSDDQYPVYGLGAALPPGYNKSIDMFALTGDIFQPEVDGIEGICRAYRSACRIVRMHGPTLMSEAVEHAGRAAEPFANVEDPTCELCFSIMVIMTDADIEDKEQFLNSVVRVASLPLHIIFIGMGCNPEDAKWMRSVPRLVREKRWRAGVSEEELALRDVVRFVEMTALNDSSVEDVANRVQEDAALALKMIPREVLGFYRSKGVKPRGLATFENDSGEANPPPTDMYSKEEKKQLKTMRMSRKSMSAGDAPSSKQLSTRVSRLNSMATSRATSRASSQNDDDDDAEDMEQNDRVVEHSTWKNYLSQRKEEIRNRTKKLGFHRVDIERVLREGLPSEDPEAMADMLQGMGENNFRVRSYKSMLVDMQGANANPDCEEENNFSDVEELRGLIKGARALLRCDRMSVYLYSPAEGQLRLYAENFGPVSVSTSSGIAALAFRSNETLIIKDCYEDFRFDQSLDKETGYTTRSMSVVPVIRDGGKKPVGVVQAINKLPPMASKFDPHAELQSFTENDVQLLQVLATELGYALSDGFLSVDETLAKLGEMVQLSRQLVVDVNSIKTQVLKTFTQELAAMLHCDKASVFIHDKKTGELLLHSFNLPGELTIRMPVHGIVGYVFCYSQPVVCDDAYMDSRFDPTKDAEMKYRTKSMLALHIADEDTETVGVIQAINRLQPDVTRDDPNKLKHIIPFSGKDEDLVKLAATRLAPFIARGSLTTDDCKQIVSELKTARSYGKKVAARALTKKDDQLNKKDDQLNALKDEKQAAIERIMHARIARPEALPTLCLICMEFPADVSVRPCGHQYACNMAACRPKVGSPCFICQEVVQEIIMRPGSRQARPTSGGPGSRVKRPDSSGTPNRPDSPATPFAGAPVRLRRGQAP